MDSETLTAVLLLALFFGAVAAIAGLSGQRSLDGIKSRTVGDGQHGTARWSA